MSLLTSVHPPLATVASSTSPRPWDISFLAKLSRDLFGQLRTSYRPELHYMRGPGPRWREKHGTVSGHHGRIPSLGRAESEGMFPEMRQHTDIEMRQHTDTAEVGATHSRHCPANANPMHRETATVTAIDFRRGHTRARVGHTQAREIVEARRGMIAELEQRRRVPWDWDHEVSQAA
jgi:hypothetical protein